MSTVGLLKHSKIKREQFLFTLASLSTSRVYPGATRVLSGWRELCDHQLFTKEYYFETALRGIEIPSGYSDHRITYWKHVSSENFLTRVAFNPTQISFEIVGVVRAAGTSARKRKNFTNNIFHSVYEWQWIMANAVGT